MTLRNEASSLFLYSFCKPLSRTVDFMLILLLFLGIQTLSAASINIENENQIHEFHKHLSRYNNNGKDLRELATNAPDKTVHSVTAPPAMGVMSDGSPEGQFLFDTEVCRADAIVIGTIISLKTLISADNSTVFTDYKVSIDKAIENRSRIVLQVGKPVIVTLNGGVFLADGLKIEQVGFDRPSPLTPSRKYLFLLKALSDNASFGAFGMFAVEYIDNTGLHVISQHPFQDRVNRFLEAFSVDSIEEHIRQTFTNCSLVDNR